MGTLESNPGLLGEKRQRYLCDMPFLTLLSEVVLNQGLHIARRAGYLRTSTIKA